MKCSAVILLITVGSFITLLQASLSGSSEDIWHYYKQLTENLNQKITLLEKNAMKQDSRIRELETFATKSLSERALTARTCNELKANDPTLSSGMYYIDPDGQGVGDAAIYVYCNMDSGSTSILHNNEATTSVRKCPNPGCYSQPIEYSASARQMAVLAELSQGCRQSIKYDCSLAPFERDGISYSWWNDRNGAPQYFWSGSNSSIHTCSCGSQASCYNPALRCNCDAYVSNSLFDDGMITVKSMLPITRLNFGYTQAGSSNHTLGRMECFGSVIFTGQPESCVDLWMLGQTLSGFYSVKKSGKINTLFCDMTKVPGEDGMETWIGFSEVKSSPVYFYVQRNGSWTGNFTTIPFEIERVNIGDAMNGTSGVFTTPTSGIYQFSFSGVGDVDNLPITVSLYWNGNNVTASSYASPATAYHTATLTSILSLEAGDEIELRLTGTGKLYDYYQTFYSHFSGFLLDQKDLFK